MLALKGYYDGNSIQTLEKLHAQKNQKLIITVLDEFMESVPAKEEKQSARGALNQYANPVLWDQEADAWERAVAETYGDA